MFRGRLASACSVHNSRAIGFSDGVYNGASLEKDQPLKLFQSYTCRHFRLDFNDTTSVDGISAYNYTFNKDNFNPNVGDNSGYVNEK